MRLMKEKLQSVLSRRHKMNIIGENKKKINYDPNLAEKINQKVEGEKRKKEIEELRKKSEAKQKEQRAQEQKPEEKQAEVRPFKQKRSSPSLQERTEASFKLKQEIDKAMKEYFRDSPLGENYISRKKQKKAGEEYFFPSEYIKKKLERDKK